MQLHVMYKHQNGGYHLLSLFAVSPSLCCIPTSLIADVTIGINYCEQQ